MSEGTRRRAGLARRLLTSDLASRLAHPHGVDRFLEQVHPLLTVHAVRGTVTRVVHETGAASTVEIAPNRTWAGFRPGQHVQFGVEVDGKRRVRCFSVSSSTARTDGRFTVTVKVHEDGYVSRHLRHALEPGTIVYLSPAEGEFVLPARVPDGALLLSGGSGITPVMSMLRSLRDAGHDRPLTFVHYARSGEDEIFHDELDKIAASCPWVDLHRVYTREPEPGELQGRFTRAHLDAIGVDPATTPTWACGPAGLIETVRKTWAEAGAEDLLTVEYFKVPSVQLDAADATGTLSLETSGRDVANDGRTILEQAEDAGLSPEFGCRMGICHKCTIRKKHGAVRHVLTGEVRADTDEDIQICVNKPVGDVCVAL